MKHSPLFLLLNLYGWIIFAMSVVTAVLVGEWWIVLFGVIGYLMVLVVELMWGGALGRTGRIRLARAEQENRELRDEKARLVGTIEELMEKAGRIPNPEPNSPSPETPESAGDH
ncbi:MAG TPA: hypothetical protein VMN57_07030 [Anaerolineales bacterium]|nr:hypothetical protein [Anaerolineales bacterium]